MISILCFLRALLYPIILIPYTMVWSAILITILILGVPRKRANIIVKDIWGKVAIFLAGGRVQLIGLENVPKKAGYLYTFTHSSFFDIPVLFGYSPRHFSFGSKEEILKIPIFGYAGRLMGNLPIARKEVAKVKEVYKNAEKRVAAGDAFALAPEGGRRKTPEIAKFKTGPFIFAINAKMPIVPTVMYGVDTLLPNHSKFINLKRWRTNIYVQFLPPIETKDINPKEAKALRDHVQELTVTAYEELRKKPL